MNVAALEALLPTLTNTLLTEVTSTAQVLVADEPHAALRSDFHVLWRFVETVPLPDAGGLGRAMHGLRYAVEVRDGGATQAERRAWPLELHTGLHQELPTDLLGVTGLDHVEVLRITVAPAEAGVIVPGASGAVLGEADVLFVGDV